ncbi:MAG: EF-P lysine aminoacylase GenX [Rickettsiales bacterium]|jgi:lysyl-tRNA synthetase class 2|nr:EF-P lysine aminoacylase GenX [Rickettsiales bacterium]
MHSQTYRAAKDAFARKRANLNERARILAAIKTFFASEGFAEVETPILQLSPGMEVHLNAFETKFEDITHTAPQTLMLHTSPEFAMKKLLGFGMEKIYQFAHVFRNEIVSPTHYPEFIMLEWYRAHEGYEKLMSDCEKILAATAPVLTRDNMKCDTQHGLEKLTVAEAMDRYCDGLDLMATIDDSAAPTPAKITAETTSRGINVSASDTWDDVFEKLMLEFVEPSLGQGKPTILYEYPLHLAALSAPKKTAPNIAERFELYACGVELANAFTELTDAEIQLERFARDMAEKKRLYNKEYPIDMEFIEAVADMPPSTGIALGFERLVMLATGTGNIRDVMWSEIPGV